MSHFKNLFKIKPEKMYKIKVFFTSTEITMEKEVSENNLNESLLKIGTGGVTIIDKNGEVQRYFPPYRVEEVLISRINQEA